MIKKWWRIERMKLYTIYHSMKQRCEYEKNISYKNYWGRWIRILWGAFEEFYEDMQPAYKEWLSIDREDTDWDYCKENCKWSTRSEQNNNKRNNVILEYKWKKMTVAQWASELGMSEFTIHKRLKRWLSISDVLSKKDFSIRKVRQYTKDWKPIKTWDCIQDIEKKLWIWHSQIIGCCKWRKRYKTAWGFVWKYI